MFESSSSPRPGPRLVMSPLACLDIDAVDDGASIGRVDGHAWSTPHALRPGVDAPGASGEVPAGTKGTP